ncbi:MAG TPA: hypothetical protein VE173_04125 [Longimicrobiales bacterium]|nr:hypothetical protein [Longimicrobiales bacterium]
MNACRPPEVPPGPRLRWGLRRLLPRPFRSLPEARRWTAGLALALAALLGCDGGAPPGVGLVRDSAGLRIVEHAAGESGPTWRVGPEPLLRIGRVEGDAPYLFQDVGDAARLPDGGIAVLEGAAGEVRLFDRNGVHVRTLGRSGAGPGEFRSPLRVWPRGDSLVVFDWSGDRITLLPINGSTARVLTPVGLPRAYNGEVWLAGDRVIVPVKSPAPPMDRTAPVEVFISYVAVPLDGTPPDTVARISGGPQQRVQFTVGGAAMITADVSPALFQAVPLAAAGDGYLWAGSGRRPAIRRYDLRGGPGMEIRWSAPGRAGNPALVERYIEERAGASDDPDRTRETLRQIPVADSLPRFDRLMLDEVHRIWVRSFQVAPGNGLERWTVYDRDGRRVAEAELPGALGVFRVGEDWVLGLRRDELDVPHVVLLPLESTPIGSATSPTRTAPGGADPTSVR